MSGFILGSRSLSKLEGVDDRLVRAVKEAILYTMQDFSVFEGVRTIQQQRLYVARGVSKTMNSKHLTGRAVDLVPWLDGNMRWEWPLIYPIAVAMRLAAINVGADNIVWGGVWDRPLIELGATVYEMRQAVIEYQVRHPGPDFIDGPHYELG